MFKAPCADLRCRAHASGDSRDCECGGWLRYVEQLHADRLRGQ